MVARPSHDNVIRITSAQKYAGPSSYGPLTHDMTHPEGIPIPRPTFRQSDPEGTTVSELGPEALGHRVVVRSREFLGTVYGTLLAVDPHPTLRNFTSIQLYGKKLLTFRDDTECVVVG